MSRSYSILCLSHDPAFELDRGVWNRREEVEQAVAERADDANMAPHLRCDLMMAEYSGGLISLGCPARTTSGLRHVPFHSVAKWEDVVWLRLVLAARGAVKEFGPDYLNRAVGKLPDCWSERRLNRLTGWLSS